MKNGTVKKLVAERGFGFVTCDGEDVFFHHSDVVTGTIESLQEGQSVSYEIDDSQNSRGPRAINVTPK